MVALFYLYRKRKILMGWLPNATFMDVCLNELAFIGRVKIIKKTFESICNYEGHKKTKRSIRRAFALLPVTDIGYIVIK